MGCRRSTLARCEAFTDIEVVVQERVRPSRARTHIHGVSVNKKSGSRGRRR